MNNLVVAIHVIVIVLAAFLINARQNATLRPYFIPALVFKCVCGLLIGWLYIDFYKLGDTLLFFQDGTTLTHIARTDFGAYLSALLDSSSIELLNHEPRTVFLIKIASVFLFLTYDNYWVTAMYFSIAAFSGAWFFVSVVHRTFRHVTPAAAIAFLFFPSIVFWSSGLIKESFASGALFFLAGCFLLAMTRQRITWLQTILVVLSAWILWSLKYYYLAIFGAVAVTSLISNFAMPLMFPSATISRRVMSWFIVFILLIAVVSLLHPNFYLSRIMTVITDNYYAFVSHSSPGDVISFDGLRPEFWSMVKSSPKAFVCGLFSPFIWQATNMLQYIAAIENTTILVLAIAALTRFKKLWGIEWRLLSPWLVFIAIMATFITLSTPNFGTLVRYRVGYLPFFVLLILINNPLVAIISRRFSLFSKR